MKREQKNFNTEADVTLCSSILSHREVGTSTQKFDLVYYFIKFGCCMINH